MEIESCASQVQPDPHTKVLSQPESEKKIPLPATQPEPDIFQTAIKGK